MLQSAKNIRYLLIGMLGFGLVLLVPEPLGFAQTPANTNATQPAQPNYTRVMLSPKQATGLKLQATGSTLSLQFEKADGITPALLKQRLGPTALGVQQGASKNEFIVNLKKPYRVRQFVSSDGVGLDVLESIIPPAQPENTTKPETKPAATANSPAKQKPSSLSATATTTAPSLEKKEAKKPVSSSKLPVNPPFQKITPEITTDKIINKAKPEPLLATKPAPQPIIKTPAAPTVVKQKETVSTPEKKPVISPQPKEASPQTLEAIRPPANDNAATLTTKKLTDARQEKNSDATQNPPRITEYSTKPSALSSPIAATSPSISGVVSTTKPTKDATPAKAEEKPNTDTSSGLKPAKSAEKPHAAPENPDNQAVEKPVQPLSFIVGVEPSKDGAALIFPYTARTAAAVFKRGRDWWVIFSTPSHVDLPQLRSLLPTTVTQIEQFNAPNQTILRLSTDGSLILNASQPKGGYSWKIALSTSALPPASYLLHTMADAKAPYVEIGAYDVAPTLSLTDPKIGDVVTIVPSFESEKAVTSHYQNPDLAFIPAQQGIAFVANNENLTTSQGRTGLRITTLGGLSIAKDLPNSKEATQELSNDILLPYHRWKVSAQQFIPTQVNRTLAFSNATQETKPKAMLDLATLYLGQGFTEEALSLLSQMRDRYPAFYRENQLAALRAAANFMLFRMPEAAADITSEELKPSQEINLWKEAISLFIPSVLTPKPLAPDASHPDAAPIILATPDPHFDYLKYNNAFISHYPPKIRQKLAIVATDNYISNKEYSKAARTLDTLNNDGLLVSIQKYAEYLLGKIAADTGKIDQAINLWKPLANQQDDLLIRARAEFSLVTLEYANGKRSLKSTITHLDKLRLAWRGDTLEQNLLSYLGQLYLDNKDYGNALRTWRDLVRYYPNAANGFDITKKMATLFEQLFSEGLADDLPPLRSLGLFYEFKDLTPVGARGDLMIQKLADRLAKIDLLDKASALLEHQVKFRLQGEDRSKVGAQLAIVDLLNQQPEKALEALEISGYGQVSDTLAAERNRITALALSKTKKPELALELLSADRSAKGQDLRLEILWELQDWPNVITVSEDALSNRADLTQPLSMKESETLLKLALAYSFEQNLKQLKYLREYYTPLLSDSPYKSIFDYVTNDTAPIDPEDFSMVAKQISSTETFLKSFKDSIADGRLSTTLNAEGKDTDAADSTSAVNEATSLSEKNRPLIPESVEPATIEDTSDADEKTDDEAQPQNLSAPVKVEDAPNTNDAPAGATTPAATTPNAPTPNAQELPQIKGADALPANAPPKAATITTEKNAPAENATTENTPAENTPVETSKAADAATPSVNQPEANP